MSSLADCFYRGTDGEMTKSCLEHHEEFPVIVTITHFFIYRLFNDAVAVAETVWCLIIK